jgi:hypothetical protein
MSVRIRNSVFICELDRTERMITLSNRASAVSERYPAFATVDRYCHTIFAYSVKFWVRSG